MRRINAGLLTLLPCAALLGACAGTDLKPIATLSASNALAPSGYSETKLSDTQYQVKATGTEATPKVRIEKIARARAAQIGVEQKLKYYKVANVQFGVTCSKKHEFYKGGATQPGNRQTVLLDVVYAKEPLDATYLSASESYDALSGELSNEVIPPEAKAAAEQEARAGCGQAT
ncbi:MAG: hypothetical protein K8F92_18035 [Hyphomicrobium sp.]|uniref:hypothetical protein n=1 Tax=Hyphomicrobium sp. TaxID=82 RepID=UPI0013209E9C|nr:hypothetical protein [Hyphomicrobium sp.]KAB2938431.1 MAG: hypothetical protein F9K20_18910 [Hyphomicrobium sp.]MBZ0211527.1 hypothetical protein [Hyphomicrobium sp.]